MYHRTWLNFIFTCFSFCLAVFFFLTFIHVEIFSQNLITGKKQLNDIHIYQLRYYIDKKHTYHTVNISISQTSSHTLDLFVRSHVCVSVCERQRGNRESQRERERDLFSQCSSGGLELILLQRLFLSAMMMGCTIVPVCI